jgi:NTP pyrophosphatase (non-canonical NTP hydrolase)
MNLIEYKKFVDSTALKTNEIPEGSHTNMVELLYCATKFGGEAGEVGEHIAKALRDNDGVFTPGRIEKVQKELGDALWYWIRICSLLYLDPNLIIGKNIEKLTSRKERGTLHGDGDDR